MVIRVRKIFNQKEFKYTTAIIVFINILLVSVMLLVLIISVQEFKQIYLQSKANSISAIVSKYPELETEIVNANFEKIESSQVETGLEIMKEYGYTEDLELRYLDEIYHPVFKYVSWILGFLFVLFGSQLVLNYIYHQKLYRKINHLITISNEILAGNEIIRINEYEEGEFSKLARSFREMRDVIQNQMKTIESEKQFLVHLMSDISHQIKTPLSSTMAFNELLMRDSLSDEVRHNFLEKSQIQLERIEWLIKSLLKLSKLDAKAIKFEMKSHDLNQIVKSSISHLEHYANLNQVELIFETIESETIVCCDAEWINQALMNIIKNGIEHSKNGWVRIGITPHKTLICLSIQDNGCGIEEDEIQKVFTRFYKSNKPDSVGIGLSLSKSIIEQHNGFIEVQSTYGQGTTFNVFL